MAGNYASGRLATRIGPDRMILTGSIVAAGGAGLLTALVLGTDMIPLLLFGPVMFVGVANGLSLPSAIASAISLRPELAGTASGLFVFLQLMVGALATLLGGHLQDVPALPRAHTMIAASIIAFLRHSLGRACGRERGCQD